MTGLLCAPAEGKGSAFEALTNFVHIKLNPYMQRVSVGQSGKTSLRRFGARAVVLIGSVNDFETWVSQTFLDIFDRCDDDI